MQAAPAHDDPGSTKTALLDAAEALFERHGIRGTSLRAITDRANANIASVNYHFGSKRELVSAVIARRVDPLNEERIARLEALERRGDATLEEIIHAVIAPALRRTDLYAGLRLLFRMHFEPDPDFFELVHGRFRQVQQLFFAALSRAVPELSPSTLHWRMGFAIGAMASTIANLDKIRSGQILQSQLPEDAPDLAGILADEDAVTNELVRFLAAAVSAPQISDQPIRTSDPLTDDGGDDR